MLLKVDMDYESADSFAIPSTDGRGETLEELNSSCLWITTADNEDACWAECYPDPIARAAGIHIGMTSYTSRMAYIRSTLQKILDFHMWNLVRLWQYATLDNRIWHPEPAYCTAQQHANTTLEPAPANAVSETLDLSASSRVMSLSAYMTEDEFEDGTEFGDAMMRSPLVRTATYSAQQTEQPPTYLPVLSAHTSRWLAMAVVRAYDYDCAMADMLPASDSCFESPQSDMHTTEPDPLRQINLSDVNPVLSSAYAISIIAESA